MSSRVEFGVFDRIVQDRRDDRCVVDFHVGKNGGDFERMRKIWIAGSALLRSMSLHRIDVGAVERNFVGVRVVAPDPVYEFILPHHN